MVERIKDTLSETLKAVGEPTRRSILTTLIQEGPTRVTELAARYEMSLNSVSKHIKVLEKAGLVTRRTVGRVHLMEANLGPVDAAEEWFAQLRSIWDIRLEELDHLLTKKDDEMTELTLTTTRVMKATPEAIFNAWLDPEMLAKFMQPMDGMSVPEASADPVEGGRFDILMRAGENDMPHHGFYKKIVPHSELVFSWNSHASIDGNLVTLKLSPKGDGTKVELTHVKFPDEQARDSHLGGWTAILAKLDEVL